jgi:DNA transposition AAA+ family ATPase
MISTTNTAIVTSPSHGGGLNIAAHDFELVLRNHYDDHSSEVLRFWFFTAKKHNWNLKKLATTTGLSTTVIYRLLRGEYNADHSRAIETLEAARLNLAESADNPDFIETSLSKRLFTIFDKTRALHNVSILWGRMGIGKTECTMEYIRRSPVGRTAYVRFPAGASFAQVIQHIGRALGVARTGNAGNCRERIIQLLSMGQRLLIVDELHQAFLTTRTDTAVKCCEFLREISDVAGCGLVLIGTELLEESIFRGPHKDALKQLLDRGTVQVPLPSKATQNDFKLFLKAYGLNFPDANQDAEAAQILNDIIRSAGLRKLTLHLRDGKAYANKRDEAYTWDHFAAAFQAIQSLSKA